MAEYTPNFNLIKPAQEDFYNVDDFNENFTKIDQQAVKKGTGIGELSGGTLANRPAASTAGRYYFAQDTGEIFLDTGTEWVLAAASQSKLNAHLADKASQSTLGHVKVDGNTVIIDENGVISASGVKKLRYYMGVKFNG